MSPDEFRAARESLGLSAREMGAFVCVSGRTVRRYEAGRSAIPELVARIVGILTGRDDLALRLRADLFARGLAAELNPGRPEIPPGPTEPRIGGEERTLGEGLGGPDP